MELMKSTIVLRCFQLKKLCFPVVLKMGTRAKIFGIHHPIAASVLSEIVVMGLFEGTLTFSLT